MWNNILLGGAGLMYWAAAQNFLKKDPRKEEIRLLTAHVEKCAGGIDHWAMVEKASQWVLSQKGFEKLSPAEVDVLTYRYIREGYEGELRAAEARLKPLVEEVAAEEAKAKAEREKQRAEEDARYAAAADDDPGSADDDVDGGDEAEKAHAEQIRELTRECEFLRKADRSLTAERNAAHATIARQIEEIRALTASREQFQLEVARGAGIIERQAKQVRDLTAERDALREADATGNRLLTKADRDIAALKTERDTLLVERADGLREEERLRALASVRYVMVEALRVEKSKLEAESHKLKADAEQESQRAAIALAELERVRALASERYVALDRLQTENNQIKADFDVQTLKKKLAEARADRDAALAESDRLRRKVFDIAQTAGGEFEPASSASKG